MHKPNLKLAAIVAACACLSTPALAQNIDRIRADKTTCSALQERLDQTGAAIIQYPSTRVANYLLYDRYVASAAFCRFGQTVEISSVPTSDNQSCRVYKCVDFEPLFDCDNFRFGSRTLCRD